MGELVFDTDPTPALPLEGRETLSQAVRVTGLKILMYAFSSEIAENSRQNYSLPFKGRTGERSLRKDVAFNKIKWYDYELRFFHKNQ